MSISSLPRQRLARTVAARWHADPADLSVEQLTQSVTSPLARCTGSTANPDDWFPVATKPACARSEAARALALCAVCPVRTECLELSMRVWHTGGQHGIWGGFVAAERAAARGRWLAGVSVAALLTTATEEQELCEHHRQERRLVDDNGQDFAGTPGPARRGPARSARR